MTAAPPPDRLAAALRAVDAAAAALALARAAVREAAATPSAQQNGPAPSGQRGLERRRREAVAWLLRHVNIPQGAATPEDKLAILHAMQRQFHLSATAAGEVWARASRDARWNPDFSRAGRKARRR